ncbi:Pectinesterase inhibitor [Melia azedarach]|uniref:Pectinesterase inhibitor n=1 Tax=Melia azedarach TaxID=155640 RepID=A0ACC1YDT5_MELAZ|nr:Pectinesterase inhibitor [Melia azedarach]
MKRLVFFLLLEAVAFLPLIQCDTPLIEKTCQRTPFYDLCISSLKSDPRSSTADVRTLALIMVDIIKSKATQMLKQVEELQKQHPELQEPLSACHSRYNAVLVGDVPQAVEALEKGDYKFAEDSATDAAIEADACENGFSAGKSPISPMNKLFHDISVITASIVNILLGGG